MQQGNEYQNSPGDETDRLLDAALKQYSAVQPREGLENRILAHLRSQSAERATHSWRGWLTAAAAVAALAVIITMSLRPHAKPQSRVAQHPSAALPAPKLTYTSPPKNAVQRPKRRLQAAPDTQVAKALPKLDQFPSPQPLSQEELVLARYAMEFPAEATLIAKAQDEYEREVQREMRSTDSGIRPSGLDK
ncbi:MAG TPA: hypothetical protein VF123_03360 [Candidatus Sulfotelmatobacter sp.]